MFDSFSTHPAGHLSGCPFFFVSFSRQRLTSTFVQLQTEYPMTSPESNELKLLYIEETLSQHGEWLADILTEAIEKRKLRRTDDLLHSIDYSSFHEGKNPGLRFSFLSYGRAVDIAAYKRNRHKVNTMEVVWGQKQNTMKKNNRWYAQSMYSGYYSLVSRLMYGLGEQEIERLKGILENRKRQSTI